MDIRPATDADWPAIWAAMEPAIREGETLTLDRETTADQAHEVAVAVVDGAVVGSSFLRPNQPGPGSHVGNCGYIVAPSAAGQGIARALCRHTQERGRERGFRALQFNIVISTNTRAVAAWEGEGFHIAGTLPGAFRRPNGDYVDAYVMFKSLV
jgi:ribosomal protein S18 acetylase RimI-like enzyme